MRVTSLASGSSGNALLVEAGPQGRTKLLVDAGLSSRILIERLRETGTHPAQLKGVLITHEHFDHIFGLPILMKRFAIPVITAPETLAAVEQSFASGASLPDTGPLSPNIDLKVQPQEQEMISNPGDSLQECSGDPCGRQDYPHLDSLQECMARQPRPGDDAGSPRQDPNILRLTEFGLNGHSTSQGITSTSPQRLLQPGSRCVIGDIEVISFPVSHDAVAPCGFLLSAGGCRVCIVIDSGEVTAAMLEAMQNADLLILESNHDRERLLRGPYPYHLKQRILSPTGHLSNDQAADAVLRTWCSDSVRWLWLSHLSRTNNTPRLALKSMLARLEAAKADLSQIHINVLPPGMGSIWDSTQLWKNPSLWEWNPLQPLIVSPGESASY